MKFLSMDRSETIKKVSWLDGRDPVNCVWIASYDAHVLGTETFLDFIILT